MCNDIKIIDQLIMIALACGLVNRITIEDKNDKIFLIMRTNQNDKLPVIGVKPDITSQSKDDKTAKQDYTLKKINLIEKKRAKITYDLSPYIEIIKTGFKFFGINVSLNKEKVDQLDFFNNENKLIFSKKFEDTDSIILKFDCMLNQKFRIEFSDSLGNEFTYLCDNDRHIFILYSELNKYSYCVEIT